MSLLANVAMAWDVDYGGAVLRPESAVTIISAKAVAWRGQPSREDVQSGAARYRPATHDWVFSEHSAHPAVRDAWSARRPSSRTSVVARVGFTGQRRRAYGR